MVRWIPCCTGACTGVARAAHRALADRQLRGNLRRATHTIRGKRLRVVREVFDRATREGITLKELEQAKNKTKSHAVISSERPMRRLRSVGGNWIQHGEYHSLRDELDQISAVTLDDVMQLLHDYPLDQATTVAIGPRDDLVAV